GVPHNPAVGATLASRSLQPLAPSVHHLPCPLSMENGMAVRKTLSTRAEHAARVALCLAASACSGMVHAAQVRSPACSLVDATTTQDLVMRVPFEVVDGRIYVQAEVDGRGPFRFAVDTGASGLGRADSSLVATLGLELDRP